MPTFFTTLAAILSLVATVTSITVALGTIKQRKNEPNEKRWTELTDWRLEVDEHFLSVDKKLDSDNRRLKRMDDEHAQNRDFQRIMLKSMKGIIDASSTGNPNDAMRQISAEIDEFLIKR